MENAQESFEFAKKNSNDFPKFSNDIPSNLYLFYLYLLKYLGVP